MDNLNSMKIQYKKNKYSAEEIETGRRIADKYNYDHSYVYDNFILVGNNEEGCDVKEKIDVIMKEKSALIASNNYCDNVNLLHVPIYEFNKLFTYNNKIYYKQENNINTYDMGTKSHKTVVHIDGENSTIKSAILINGIGKYKNIFIRTERGVSRYILYDITAEEKMLILDATERIKFKQETIIDNFIMKNLDIIVDAVPISPTNSYRILLGYLDLIFIWIGIDDKYICKKDVPCREDCKCDKNDKCRSNCKCKYEYECIYNRFDDDFSLCEDNTLTLNSVEFMLHLACYKKDRSSLDPMALYRIFNIIKKGVYIFVFTDIHIKIINTMLIYDDNHDRSTSFIYDITQIKYNKTELKEFEADDDLSYISKCNKSILLRHKLQKRIKNKFSYECQGSHPSSFNYPFYGRRHIINSGFFIFR